MEELGIKQNLLKTFFCYDIYMMLSIISIVSFCMIDAWF